MCPWRHVEFLANSTSVGLVYVECHRKCIAVLKMFMNIGCICWPTSKKGKISFLIGHLNIDRHSMVHGTKLGAWKIHIRYFTIIDITVCLALCAGTVNLMKIYEH
jgi:hypothetical protein